MAPLVLETVSELLRTYVAADWSDEEKTNRHIATLGMAIGDFCEAFGGDEDVDFRASGRVVAELCDFKSKLCSNPSLSHVTQAKLAGVVDVLSCVVRSLSASSRGRDNRARRVERITPKIDEIKAALADHDVEAFEMSPGTAKKLCEILGYNASEMVFVSDVIPQPCGFPSDDFQLDLIWLADKGHIGRTVPYAATGAFIDDHTP